jgi:hypothetical protein
MIITAACDGELILWLEPQHPSRQDYAFTAWFNLTLLLSGCMPAMEVGSAPGLLSQPFSQSPSQWKQVDCF